MKAAVPALARTLGFSAVEVANLINGKRFVTVSQALLIERALGVSARELLVKAQTHWIDEALERACSER